ncbi:transcriptional regulator, XRE family [Thermaerobacter marianensis DSM 12885]|uniref:Transcriptional regulator, XRE family n=1 Tax=Thermaerobacter marianensis (strain ATCC 700841 / DSM 12885 / JCM 10246 / 7p75a) TaxID=644966 RepID=E6SLR7_THEM7|nr:helix-turn-helix transcriptional regulator [Thermaerobacter marianensis]ADU51366.1 transcriptional regulator, XRE family [Thermaerobacter marianensis DSM 12885]
MEVGKRIRDLRRQRGISLRDLARRSGVSKAYLSQLENDPARKPSVDVILRIATALGVSLTELLGPLPAVEGDAARTPGAAAGAPGDRPRIPSGGGGTHPGAVVAVTAATAASATGGQNGSSGHQDPAPAAPSWAPAPSAPGPAGPAPGSASSPAPTGPLDPAQLPWALRVFWEEHPDVPEEDIRSLAAITWHGRRPFTPTDYWVLHQVLTGMTRGV